FSPLFRVFLRGLTNIDTNFRFLKCMRKKIFLNFFVRDIKRIRNLYNFILPEIPLVVQAEIHRTLTNSDRSGKFFLRITLFSHTSKQLGVIVLEQAHHLLTM